jgi:lysophospholipase L1-like esterase
MVRFLFLFLFSILCGNVASEKRIAILFIGNSLTYTNNLPALVAEQAKSKGVHVTPEVLAFPNYALEDHWNEGTLQKRIASKKYDYVVVQQGPSSQADGRAMLLDYGQRIKRLCDEHNVKLAFFMVWPARANSENFDGVIRNYSDAAQATGSLLCPVGKIWRAHFEATHDYSYYGPDGFHPSTKGSAVAAAVIIESLFAKMTKK